MSFEQLEVNWDIFSFITVIIGSFLIRLCPIIIPMVVIAKKIKCKKVKILCLCIWPIFGATITYFCIETMLIDILVLIISLVLLAIKLVLLFIKRMKIYNIKKESKLLGLPIILSIIIILFLASLFTVSYKNNLELQRHAERVATTNAKTIT